MVPIVAPPPTTTVSPSAVAWSVRADRSIMTAPSDTQFELSAPPRTVTEHPVFCAIFMIDDTSAAEAGCTTQAGRRRAASGKNPRSSAPAYAALPGKAALSPTSSCSSRTLSDAESVMRCPLPPTRNECPTLQRRYQECPAALLVNRAGRRPGARGRRGRERPGSAHAIEGARVPRTPAKFGFAHRGGGRAQDEWPDLLGDGPPVGGRGQLAEQPEQAEVDALQDHVGARDLGVGRHRAAHVEEPAHAAGRMAPGL